MTWENHENQYLENLMKPTFGEFFEKAHKYHKFNCSSPGVQPEPVIDPPDETLFAKNHRGRTL